jgi:hypothetical protein
MSQLWFVAAVWLLLVLVLIANWLKISTALSEIVVGTVAQLTTGALVGGEALGAKTPWITFLAQALSSIRQSSVPNGKSRRRRRGRLSLPVSRVNHSGALHTRVGVASQLTGWSGTLYHIGGGRLCGYAGTRLQSDHVW